MLRHEGGLESPHALQGQPIASPFALAGLSDREHEQPDWRRAAEGLDVRDRLNRHAAAPRTAWAAMAAGACVRSWIASAASRSGPIAERG